MNTFDMFIQVEDMNDDYEYQQAVLEEYIKSCNADRVKCILQDSVSKIQRISNQSHNLTYWYKYITDIYNSSLSNDDKDILKITCNIFDSKDFMHIILYYLY